MPFSCIIASKDWHPKKHGSFAKTHGKPIGETIQLNGISQVLWPEHCVQNSLGSEFPKTLHQEKIGKLIFKGTDSGFDSYSAFFDNGHEKSTGLDAYLKKHGITDLYIAGLATDYCVKFSVLDALSLGFRTFLVLDACRAVNLQPEDEKKALEEMISAGAKVVFAKELNSE